MSEFITEDQFQSEEFQKTIKDLGFITDQGKRIFVIDKKYAGGMLTIWFDGRVELSVTKIGTNVSRYSPLELARLLQEESDIYKELAQRLCVIDGILDYMDYRQRRGKYGDK